MSNTVAKLNIHLGASTGALRKDFQEAEGIVAGFGKSFSGLTGMMGGMLGGAAAGGFFGWGVKLAAEAETALVSFEVMLGSVAKAKSMLGDLKAFSAATPFEFPELQGAAKTLLAFGIQGEQIIPTLQMLGDVSGGNAEKLSSLAVVFGQIASAGKLTGGDLLQLINVGFNPLQVIAQKTGKSMSELKDAMSKGQITFAMVEDAFKTATAEGGLFFGMMEKQSKTLSGRWSTLKDNVGSLATSIGEQLLPVIGKLVDTGSALLEWLKNLDATTVQNSVKLVAFGVAFAGVVYIIPKVIGAIRAIIAAYKAFTAAQVVSMAFSGPKGWAQLAAGAVIAGVAVYGVSEAFASINEAAAKAQAGAEQAADKTTASVEGTSQAAQLAAGKLNAFGLGVGEMAEQIKLADKSAGTFAMTIESFAQKGRQVTEQLQTPLEAYADRMMELQELIDHGAVSWETYSRGVQAASKDLQEATAAKQAMDVANVRVGAVTRFSTAGFSAVEDAKDNSEKLRAVAAAQLETQKLQLAQQQEANRLLERQGFRTTVVAIP